MAEYGVHHATTSGSNPSIFEVIGEENLLLVLRSSFRHIFRILAENYPEKYSLIYKYFDEGYTIVDSVFQYIHLRLKGGLFPETFYGLKRIPDPRSGLVSRKKVVAWVLLAVVFPYVQSQLKNIYKNLQEDEYRGNLHMRNLKISICRLYLRLYPCYNFAWEAVILCYYMAFALGKTRYHSPLLHATSTTLTHLTSKDYLEDSWKDFITKSEQKKFSTAMWSYINVFVSGFTLTVSLGAFLTQFLDWWYNQEGTSTALTSLPVPDPPRKWSYDAPFEKCPICKKTRTNDTALASSGFVFCYPCIFSYVQENERCPITGYKSTLKQLVKLYHQE